MAKITIEKLVVLDVRIPGNKELLLSALSKTKWLDKYSQDEITLEILEKLYLKVKNKYSVSIGYIQDAGDNSWVFMIKNTETHSWINTVYAISLFEGMAKSILTLYGYLVKEIAFHDTKRRDS